MLYDSIRKDCPDTGRSTRACIVFYQGGLIDHSTNIPRPVDKSSAKSEYNAACTTGIALAHFSMLNDELFNKDPDMVPEQAPIITLDIK